MFQTENGRSIMRRLLVLLSFFLLSICAAQPSYAETTPANMVGTFEIEQVYVNVPEMDVFLYAMDSSGNSIDPRTARAAGVTLQLGDSIVPTGTISQAAEPICYIFAIDNSYGVDRATLNAYKAGIRQMIAKKAPADQIVLYTLAGGTKCVQPATDDATTARIALSKVDLAQSDDEHANITAAATEIYADVQQDFQSLAPRRVIMACTDSTQVISDAALLATMASGVETKINMAVYTYVAMEKGSRLEMLEGLSNGRLVVCNRTDIPASMLETQAHLGKALELKTAVDTSAYGQKLDVLTISVPALGSAIKTSTTVYMGNCLQKPTINAVTVKDRTHLEVSFNQAVTNAEFPSSYHFVCEDIWGWRPEIKAVEMSDDDMSATLTTEPMYSGNFDISLRKVTSKMTAANISSTNDVYSFKLEKWTRDQAFYINRFRLPLIVAGVLLAALAISAMVQKHKDKEEELQAEAEHLLQNGVRAAEIETLPSRWLTLFIKPYKAIAETRWTQTVKNSLIIGSDPAQCDLCIQDSRVAAQHCALSIEGDTVLVRAIDEHFVRVNGERIGDAHRLQNNDRIKIGRSTLRFVA